jgi:hypothetical protein
VWTCKPRVQWQAQKPLEHRGKQNNIPNNTYICGLWSSDLRCHTILYSTTKLNGVAAYKTTIHKSLCCIIIYRDFLKLGSNNMKSSWRLNCNMALKTTIHNSNIWSEEHKLWNPSYKIITYQTWYTSLMQLLVKGKWEKKLCVLTRIKFSMYCQEYNKKIGSMCMLCLHSYH